MLTALLKPAGNGQETQAELVGERKCLGQRKGPHRPACSDACFSAPRHKTPSLSRVTSPGGHPSRAMGGQVLSYCWWEEKEEPPRGFANIHLNYKCVCPLGDEEAPR